MDHAHAGRRCASLLKHRAELFETDQAVRECRSGSDRSVQGHANDATAYADRGYFYMRRGRYRDALGDFVTGSRLDPQNPLYMYAAARSLVAMEDFAGAVAFYTEAIKIGPERRKALSRARRSAACG